jgi:hypothetical protein
LRGRKGTCFIIDVSVPSGTNVVKREAEIVLKYRDLLIEVQLMWNVKAKVI